MVSSKPHHSTVNNFQHHWQWMYVVLSYPGHLTWDHHNYYLQDELPQILEDAPLQVRLSMWLQHNSFQPHFHQQVNTVLKPLIRKLLDWTKTSDAWPPLNFYLQGNTKELVNQQKLQIYDGLHWYIKNGTALVLNNREDIQKAVVK